MTRDEFMEQAKQEIENALRKQRNIIMNLVQQAWVEGKHNAEVETLSEAIKDAFKATPFIVQPQPTWIPGTTHPNIQQLHRLLPMKERNRQKRILEGREHDGLD